MLHAPDMKQQIITAIEQFQMLTLKPDEKIIVGLSGGADSVALTHFLHFELGCNVIACHINHGLRGEESDRDMAFVESLCDEWEIPCYIEEVNVAGFALAHSLTVEEAGREVRYAAFTKLLLSQNAEAVATAHTLSDNAETLLLNLARGTGLRGLCGIPPKRIIQSKRGASKAAAVIRPLIFCTRAEIEDYCGRHGLSYVEDSTNMTDEFARNNIRHNVIPVLQELNPSFYAGITRTVRLLCEDRDYIEEQANSARFFCAKEGDSYDISTLKGQPRALRTRVLADLLKENDIGQSYSLLLRLDNALKDGGKLNVSSNKFAEVSGNYLSFTVPIEEIPYFEEELTLGEWLSPWLERYRFFETDIETINSQKKVYKNLLYLCMDYDRINGKLVVRQRKTGDEIEFSHRAGKRVLKKLFIDEKLSAYEKSKTLVFSDDEGVVGVFGFGVSARVCPDERSVRILAVEQLF